MCIFFVYLLNLFIGFCSGFLFFYIHHHNSCCTIVFLLLLLVTLREQRQQSTPHKIPQKNTFLDTSITSYIQIDSWLFIHHYNSIKRSVRQSIFLVLSVWTLIRLIRRSVKAASGAGLDRKRRRGARASPQQLREKRSRMATDPWTAGQAEGESQSAGTFR